ncbi:hypothetical protein ACJX0J_031393, partial [Zea mays]
VAMFLHVQILQGSIIAIDGTPISSFELTFFIQGARPALSGGLGGGALWDEDTFVISLEEGHYAAYIKMMALKYMTDEDVAVEALILSDVTDLPTHPLCYFAVFGANINNYFIFTSPNATLVVLSQMVSIYITDIIYVVFDICYTIYCLHVHICCLHVHI